jgi:Tfp pilus assembly protein PilO
MNIVSKFTIEKNIQYRTDEGFRNNVNFILTFVAVLIFGVFAIRPSITTISGLARDLGDYNRINEILVEKIAILNDIKSDKKKLLHENALINEALPPTPDEGNYIRNVNFIAAKNNIPIESINFTVENEEGAPVGSLNFSLAVYGQYPDLVKFISDFNKLLRITNIENIDITPQNEDIQTVKAVITGKTYFLQEKNVQN